MRNGSIAVIIFFCFVSSAVAKEFGLRSHCFPIKEESFLEMVQRKLKAIDLEKENEKMQKIARERIQNPLPVFGLLPATVDREFFYDPSYTLQEDIILPCGRILHKAGSKVNPLDHIDLDGDLFFIDGRVEGQIKWLQNELSSASSDAEGFAGKIILVGGSVFKLQEILGRIVYFDQNGELTTKFGIKASPANVKQDGKMLKIREFNIKNME